MGEDERESGQCVVPRHVYSPGVPSYYVRDIRDFAQKATGLFQCRVNLALTAEHAAVVAKEQLWQRELGFLETFTRLICPHLYPESESQLLPTWETAAQGARKFHTHCVQH